MKRKELNKEKNIIGNQKEKVKINKSLFVNKKAETNKSLFNNEKEKSKINNKIILITILVLLIFSFLIGMRFLNKNYYNSGKFGNNTSIKEIEKTILNINSYKAEIEVTIKSNKNENKYKLYQEVKDGKEMQKVIEPEILKGTEIIYENGNLQIKNTQINASKIYTNYPYIANNELFLSDFLNNFNKSSNKEIRKEENKIVFILRNGKIYNQEQILTIEKNNSINNENKQQNYDQNYNENKRQNTDQNDNENKPQNNDQKNNENKNKNQNTNQNDNNKMKMTMQIIDSNNNVKIYIIYNKIEFNI